MPGIQQRSQAPRPNRQARKLIAQIRRDPGNDAAIRALRDHYTSIEDFPSLANLLEGWATRTSDARLASQRFVEAAEVTLLGELENTRAAYLLEHALTRTPHKLDLLNQLSDLLDAQQAYEPLKHALQRQILRLNDSPNTEPGLQAEVEFRLGRVHELHLRNTDKAMRHYRRAVEHDKSHLAALGAAKDLYLDAGNHHAAALLWEMQVRAAPSPEQKTALLLELASLQERFLDEPDKATASLRRVLRVFPAHKGAIEQLAGLLERRYEHTAAAQDQERARDLRSQLAPLAAHQSGYGPSNPSAFPREDDTEEVPIFEMDAAALATIPVEIDEAPPEPTTAPARVSSPALEAWLHTEDLAPLASSTAPLEPIPTDASEAPPELLPMPHSRMVNTLNAPADYTSLEVNLGPTTPSNLYIGLEGGLLEGGVFASTYVSMPIGSKVALTITLPGGFNAQALGKVRFRRDVLDAGYDQDPGLAIEFEQVTPEDLELIARFANQRAPMLYDS